MWGQTGGFVSVKRSQRNSLCHAFTYKQTDMQAYFFLLSVSSNIHFIKRYHAILD